MFACADIDACEADSNQSFLAIDFHDRETLEQRTVGFEVTDKFRTDSTGSPVLYPLESDSASIHLPFNAQDTTSTFVFRSDTSEFELSIRYEALFSIFDPQCDPSILFQGIDTLNNDFDSLAILGRTANRVIPTNIEVYF